MTSRPFGVAGANIKTGQALIVDPKNGMVVPATADDPQRRLPEEPSTIDWNARFAAPLDGRTALRNSERWQRETEAIMSGRVGEVMRQDAIERMRAAVAASGVTLGDDYVEAMVDAQILATLCALERQAAESDREQPVWYGLWVKVRDILNRETRPGEDAVETLKRLVAETHLVQRYESGEAERSVREVLGATDDESTFAAARRVAAARNVAREANRTVGDDAYLRGIAAGLQQAFEIVGDARGGELERLKAWERIRDARDEADGQRKKSIARRIGSV